MPQTHVAVIGITARSHLLPSLPMVRELVRRGHRVTVAVGEDLADLAGATGADVLAHPSLLPGEDAPATAWPESAGPSGLIPGPLW